MLGAATKCGKQEQNINILYDDEKKVLADSYTIPVGNTKKYLDAIEKIVTKVK